LDNRQITRLNTATCKGALIAIKGRRIVAKNTSTLALGGDYVIGASSVMAIKGLEGSLTLQVLVRSREGIVWESEQCIISKEACSLDRFAETLSLEPGRYVLDVELTEAPPSLEAEICVSPVPVDGGLLVTGARPGRRNRLSPAPGSTRSWSLMVSEPAKIGDTCVQRLWLWFFVPQAQKGEQISVRLERGGAVVDSIRTELMRVGIYSEVVVDVLTPYKGDTVKFLIPANLTRPLFTINTEGCGSVG